MSRYTYAGNFRNPTESWVVRSGAELIEEAQNEAVAEHQPCADLHQLYDGVELDPELYYVAVEEPVNCDCPCSHCKTVLRKRLRLHSSHARGQWSGCEDVTDADELIESIEQRFEDDYDDYLDENRHSIAQMERYEAWRNEY